MKHPPTSHVAKTTQWYLSTTSYWIVDRRNVILTGRNNDIPSVIIHHISSKFQKNTHRRFSGTSPTRPGDTYP